MKVNADVVPLHIGETVETDAVRLEVTVITMFNGVMQPFKEICVNVMVTPEGHVLPRLKLPGPKLFVPPAAVVIVPLPPKDVDQLIDAPGVAVTGNALGVPAQRDTVLVFAVGGTRTVTVELDVGPMHPLREGVTMYCTVPAVVAVAVSVCAMAAPEPFEEPKTFVGVWVQLNVAPTGLLVKFKAVALPEQTDVGPVMVAVGTGLTTRSIIGVDIWPVQPDIMVL